MDYVKAQTLKVLRSETFTATGNGAVLEAKDNPFKYFSVQVKGTGAAATSWTVALQGSLDGVNFTDLVTHNANDGSVVFSSGVMSVAYIRVNVTALNLGSATDIVVHSLAMQ